MCGNASQTILHVHQSFGCFCHTMLTDPPHPVYFHPRTAIHGIKVSKAPANVMA